MPECLGFGVKGQRPLSVPLVEMMMNTWHRISKSQGFDTHLFYGNICVELWSKIKSHYYQLLDYTCFGQNKNGMQQKYLFLIFILFIVMMNRVRVLGVHV